MVNLAQLGSDCLALGNYLTGQESGCSPMFSGIFRHELNRSRNNCLHVTHLPCVTPFGTVRRPTPASLSLHFA